MTAGTMERVTREECPVNVVALSGATPIPATGQAKHFAARCLIECATATEAVA